MEFNASLGDSHSRRSYPSLNHVSVAPLTPRFPIDDDPEPADYFSPRGDAETATSGTHTPPLTSYISSVSVPSTPSLLSHSRSTSRARHARSKSSTRVAPLSDTNLHGQGVALPLHHQSQHHHQAALQKKRPGSIHARRFAEGGAHGGTSASDTEWVLRAGIALASSTREEKGQSWLSKRESSTSLVSEVPFDEATQKHHHRRNKSGASSSRRSRSGASTPGAYSRRSSRGGSRRSSRVGLTMTSMASKTAPGSGGAVSPETHNRGSALVADFVDEHIRAEMASLQQQQEHAISDEEFDYWDADEYSDSEYEYSSDEAPDAVDEADLQRLTRERGFGLGSWIDRLVEWTLFSTEEWPLPVSSSSAATGPGGARIGSSATSTTVTFEEPLMIRSGGGEELGDSLSPTSVVAAAEGEDDEGGEEMDEADMLSHTDGDSMVSIEGPGLRGGWEDAGWLFRVVKQAILL